MKKPKSPAPLASNIEIKKYKDELNEYYSFLLKKIQEESNLKDPISIVIYLCEKYHPDLKIKEKRGAKTKWSNLLKATLAVDLEAKKKKGESNKTAIYELISSPNWAKMFKKSNSTADLVKNLSLNGKKDKLSYKLVKIVYEDCQKGGKKFAENWDAFIKEGVDEYLYGK